MEEEMQSLRRKLHEEQEARTHTGVTMDMLAHQKTRRALLAIVASSCVGHAVVKSLPV